MKPRTEELLYFLLWSADRLAQPTFRNLTDSYEGWAYRQGFLRQIQALEARRILERQPGPAADAIYRLSETGRLIALGGRDPVVQWRRRWDGRWRILVFDIPVANSAARKKLTRFLKDNRFGYLQKSVWISPDPLNPIAQELSQRTHNVESIATLEAQPAAGETDADIVAGAWDFEKINGLYQKCLEVLAQLPQRPSRHEPDARAMQRWAQMEKDAWSEAFSADPLLPDRLLPANYLGKKAWHERFRTFAAASGLIRSFNR